MDKEQYLGLVEQYFKLESCIKNLKTPDFRLKSHIFFYRDIFKEVGEIKIFRVSSKNPQDDISFDIYYVSEHFDGLFSGCFKIKPESNNAKKVFQNISIVFTDLGEYLYYVYQNSEFLKIYLVSGSIENALDNININNFEHELGNIKKETLVEITNYAQEEIYNGILRRDLLKKYISNFIKLNSKCSEKVRMFLISILSDKYSNYICLINNNIKWKNYISVSAQDVVVKGSPEISAYLMLEYAVKNNLILFIKFEYDFKGG